MRAILLTLRENILSILLGIHAYLQKNSRNKNIVLGFSALLGVYFLFSIILGIRMGVGEASYLHTRAQVIRELMSEVEKNGCRPTLARVGDKEMRLVNFSCVQSVSGENG